MRAEEGERLQVQRLVVELQIEALQRMEAERFETDLWQDAELHQQADLRRTEVKTTEEGEVSGMGASEEKEVRDKDEEKDSDEGTTASGEDINGLDEDVERDEDVSNGDKYVDWDAVWGGGRSEVDKWGSSRCNRDEDKYQLEEEEMKEATQEEDIEEGSSEYEGSGEPDLPLKVAEFIAVSDNFD